jgi:hypothetical protein
MSLKLLIIKPLPIKATHLTFVHEVRVSFQLHLPPVVTPTAQGNARRNGKADDCCHHPWPVNAKELYHVTSSENGGGSS